ITIINDAYNANPASMAAALEVFKLRKLTPAQPNGRKVAVLGDMLELGTQAEQLHYQLGQSVAASDTDLLITSGPLAEHIARGALEAGMNKQTVKTFSNDDADFAKIADLLRPGDTVLLKASRAMRMERLIRALTGGGA
ncbi:MAG: UDP-N-acetylmuramoyl-tripeptide--D-alanyl-D-alanine ligase, partial [Actinobacteria bacterium]|nr:UDP-N-acetylmuramoyl-tripeptide--D-alanyl-D-alanine ligase [Actinomycetota bacterium]